jgi:hypothetical protein
MYVCNYLNGIHEIQNTNALYSIDPLQTREWARKNQTNPLSMELKASLATHAEQSQEATLKPF